MPSAVLLIPSKTPVIGLTTNPAMPYVVPIINPSNPSFYIPSNGFVINPVTPFSNPVKKFKPAY